MFQVRDVGCDHEGILLSGYARTARCELGRSHSETQRGRRHVRISLAVCPPPLFAYEFLGDRLLHRFSVRQITSLLRTSSLPTGIDLYYCTWED